MSSIEKLRKKRREILNRSNLSFISIFYTIILLRNNLLLAKITIKIKNTI